MPPYNATDPSASFLSSSCLDFLLIELVPLAFRVTRELDTAPTGDTANGTVAGAPSSTGGGASADALSSVSHSQGGGAAGGSAGGLAPSSAGGAAGGSTARKMDEDEERDAVFYRLETLGYRVGQGLVERCVCLRLRSSSLHLRFFATGKWWKPAGNITTTGGLKTLTQSLLLQILERPAAVQRHARRHQVRLQGPLVAGI